MNRGLRILLPILLLTAGLATQSTADDVPADSTRNSRLINLEGASTTPRGSLAAALDVRALNEPERNTYTSLSLRWGLAPRWELGFRGVTGTKTSLTAGNGAIVQYGGSDGEVYGKYSLAPNGRVRLAGLAGFSFPNTPAQSQTFCTLSGIGEIKITDRVTGYLNPRAILIDQNTIVGIGVGASVRVSDKWHVIGDWTGIASGQNTRSMADGSRKRGDVWGLALRYTSERKGGHVDFDLGWGNATGSTTGFSLTPGMGSSSGFYFALHVR
jgi:hypothetical protein